VGRTLQIAGTLSSPTDLRSAASGGFALLRPISDNDAPSRIREIVLEAYAEFEARVRGDN
jgi:hypothetical protein